MTLLTCDEKLRYVRHLANQNTTAIGFIPDTEYGRALSLGRIHLAKENGEPCGFVFHGPPKPTTRIYQTAVDLQARLANHGRELYLETMLRSLAPHVERVSWICATNLEANQFWTKISNPPHKTTPAKRRPCRPLNHYCHTLPRGRDLDTYIQSQLLDSTLWKIAGICGYQAKLLDQWQRRWRATNT